MKFGFASFSSMTSTSLNVFRGTPSGVEEMVVPMLPCWCKSICSILPWTLWVSLTSSRTVKMRTNRLSLICARGVSGDWVTAQCTMFQPITTRWRPEDGWRQWRSLCKSEGGWRRWKSLCTYKVGWRQWRCPIVVIILTGQNHSPRNVKIQSINLLQHIKTVG